MSSDVAIRVRGLSKQYRIAHENEKHSTLAETVLSRLKSPLKRTPREEFFALRDVNFEVKKGDVVGIIGRNGAGKSTLLKILSRITEPTTGKVELYGRVGSLLEVGTGFHPELTGRENVYLNGAILGMRRSEIARQFDAIVAFSEVEKFLDTPVKRYSSGMYVRLAFAVAAHLNPEILIVDEVLAVGDAQFQKKCLGKMQDVAGQGRTVLFVSHNMNAVANLCSKGIYLKGGHVNDIGPVEQVLEAYAGQSGSLSEVDLEQHPNRPRGTAGVFRSVTICGAAGEPEVSFAAGETVRLHFKISLSQRIATPQFGVGITNARGERIFAVATYLGSSVLPELDNVQRVSCEFTLPAILPGRYFLDISMSDGNVGGGSEFLDIIESAASIEVRDSNYLETSFPYFSHMGSLLVRSRWSLS